LAESLATLRGRAGAHAMHSRNDSKAVSQPARDAFMARFEDEVDPDHVLSEAERARRAEHALRSYMAKLALRSAKARKKAAAR
jgi:hypothetical protein